MDTPTARMLFNRCLYDVTKFATPAHDQADSFFGPAHVPRQHVRGSIQGLQLFTKSLVPIDLGMKPYQWFNDSATVWEKGASVLSPYARSAFSFFPVVDQKMIGAFGFPVVAHYGRVGGNFLYVPEEVPTTADDKWSLTPLLKEGIPVLAFLPNYNDWRRLVTPSWLTFTVLTDVEGFVTSQLGTASSDYVEPEDPVMDFIVGDVLVNLAAAAGRIFITVLVRKVAGKPLTALENAETALARARKSMAAQAAVRGAQTVAPRSTVFVSKSGITRAHFKAFQEAARENGVIALVRNGKESAIPLIEKGCPGKPKVFEPFNTNESTGILTATTAAGKELVYKSNYILVNESRVAMRRLPNGTLEKVDLQNPFWRLEAGQVIDPVLKKPVVGDYDLMGVFSAASPGQNITLHSVDGIAKANRTSPIVEKFSQTVNGKLDMPRVLHGAQDQYKGFRKGATAFFPDGTVSYMETQAEVEAFYQSVGRQTIEGAYPRPAPGVPVRDELAARRGR